MCWNWIRTLANLSSFGLSLIVPAGPARSQSFSHLPSSSHTTRPARVTTWTRLSLDQSNLSLLRDLPWRAGPLILDRTLGVYTPISVYTLLGSCAPLGFCALLGFCAPLGFHTPLGFCALLSVYTLLSFCALLGFCATWFLHGIRLERLLRVRFTYINKQRNKVLRNRVESCAYAPLYLFYPATAGVPPYFYPTLL